MRIKHCQYLKLPVSASKYAVSLWLLLLSTLAVCQQTVIYPRPESSDDVRASYPVALLQLCESKSNQTFLLQPSKVRSQQGRSLRQLTTGQEMDIVWALSTEEREKSLLPIRIPIDRGLIGWRLLLIRNSDVDLFNTIRSGSQLAAISAGQGHDWPDVEVLRANHFSVTTSSTYQGLFHMLARGHIQYFPRAVSEVWPERDRHRELGIDVDRHLAIHYPAALYFFVNKSNSRLANILESCLKTATEDGSLRKLFNQYYGDAIRQADLTHKTIIRLNNPLLPKATPIANPSYWFSPEEALANE